MGLGPQPAVLKGFYSLLCAAWATVVGGRNRTRVSSAQGQCLSVGTVSGSMGKGPGFSVYMSIQSMTYSPSSQLLIRPDGQQLGSKCSGIRSLWVGREQSPTPKEPSEGERVASAQRSLHPSGDWPEHGAPGRVTGQLAGL